MKTTFTIYILVGSRGPTRIMQKTVDLPFAPSVGMQIGHRGISTSLS